jgi:hypothetical protein
LEKLSGEKLFQCFDENEQNKTQLA